MNIHFVQAHDGGIEQGNLVCKNADGTSRQVSFRLWFDKVFITPKMIKEKQKQFNKMKFEPRYLIKIDEAANFQTKFMRNLALCRNNISFLGGLQILLEGMLPNGRHESEDYKSQSITILQIPLHSLQHYQERNSRKKDPQKIEKRSIKKEMDITIKREEPGNQEKNIRNGKNQEKKKTPSILNQEKKELENHHFTQRTNQDNTKRNINHLTKKNARIKKCDVEEIEDPMVFNLEKAREKEDFDEYIRFMKYREQYHLENEYSSSEESQSYQEPEQYELSSESSESDEEYESHNLEKKTSSESENDYYF
ncbi:21113_t:CDS:2 [Gigaspora rosea]|nr:21113_t:CDS:2 [Gigaspora rosea]